MRIAEKQKIIEELKSLFLKSEAIILTNYKGLDVASMNLLRRELRKVGSELRVAKNSLLTRASVGNMVEAISDKFKGPSAVALCYDNPVASAKVITDFLSKNDNLKIKAGMLGDKFVSVNDIKVLAALPSRDILLSQLLSSMLAVPTAMVTALNGVVGGFVNVLEAVKQQKKD